MAETEGSWEVCVCTMVGVQTVVGVCTIYYILKDLEVGFVSFTPCENNVGYFL